MQTDVMPSHIEPRRYPRRRTWIVAGAIAAIYFLLRLVTWEPPGIAVGLDISWIYALHESWLSGRVFGRDFVFTYGPYGFVNTEHFHANTFKVMWISQFSLFSVFVLGALQVFRRASARPWLCLLLLAAMVEGMALWWYDSVPYCFIVTAFLFHFFVVADDSPSKSPRLEALTEHGLAAGCALVSLIKFTFGLGAATVAFFVALDYCRRRKVPWPALTFVGAWVVLWMLAGQPIGAIPAYVRGSLEIANGYSEAMSLPGPGVETASYGVAAVLLLAILVASLWASRRRWTVIPAACFAVLLFLLFKAGFVRQQGHSRIAAATLLGSAIPICGLAWSRCASRVVRAGVVTTFACVCAFAWIVCVQQGGTGLPSVVWADLGIARRKVLEVVRRVRGNSHLLRDSEWLKGVHRAAHPLPPLDGTVDVYPTDLNLVLVNGLRYQPRPIPQSYSAYTPYLARLNADHLEGSGAPDYVLFTPEGIDGRLPSEEDGLSWPSLLTRYEDVGAVKPYRILKRRQTPLEVRWQQIDVQTIGRKSAVQLPPHEARALLWATFDVRLKFAGRLGAVFYKIPPLYVELTTSTGATGRFRLIPGVARTGFLISPLVLTADDFAAIASPGQAGGASPADVVSLKLVIERGDRWAFADEMRLEISRLEIHR
ncbi:MAG: hypothetical protein HYR85_25840 [Planctomycetes bacterium]|nr:hypothetical protein [Planctomycetota bacterium]MBI3847696.1 hypothetical protein [Planctomycetota bacterium]